MFYIINYVKVNNNSKFSLIKITEIMLILFAIISCIFLDINSVLENNGKFYVLEGTLNNIYTIYAFISNTILLIIVLIFRKKMPKGFCTLSIITFLIYISIIIFKRVTGYNVNESVLIYSLLVLIIFNTTSNQDKELVNKLNAKKSLLTNINIKRSKLINRIYNSLSESTNDIILYNDELLLTKDYNKELIQSDSKEIRNNIIKLMNYLNDIKDIFLVEIDNFDIVEYKLKTLIDNINSKILPIANFKKMNFNVYIDNNSFNYIGDFKRLSKIIINILSSAINTSKGQDISLTITNKQYDLKNIEINFMIKSKGNVNIDISSLNINSFIENDKVYDENELKMIIANELLAKFNSKVIIKMDDNNIIYSFAIIQELINNEVYTSSVIKEV